ncbi:MAG: hypothetical protein LBN99_04705 [Oscillospiraceae bacterium]|jgi:hypothetical protein|nr:hypothetical protein [Oscillospiraceae bacterium]
MKKTTTRLLTVILAVVICVSLAVPALADYTAPDSSVTLSHNPEYNISFTLTGRTFAVNGLPQTGDFRVLWLQIERNGVLVFESFAERGADSRASFTLNGLGAGKYEVSIYHAPVYYTTYHGIVWGSALTLNWTGERGAFTESAALSRNRETYSSKRTDVAALTYYLAPSRDIQSDNKDIVALANTLTAGITDDYRKAVVLHDWVCNNIYYNYDALYGRVPYGDTSAAGVLKSRRSVCEGFTNLTAALLRAVGIPAKRITGYALGLTVGDAFPRNLWTDDLSNHAWNEAFINGHWAIIDSTWNSDNSWEFGAVTDDGGLRSYRYFDAAMESFSFDHAILDYSESGIDRTVNAKKKTAVPFTGRLSFNGAAVTPAAYTVDGSTYIKIRDVAALMNGTESSVDVGYIGASNTIVLNTGAEYTPNGSELLPVQGKNKSVAVPQLHITIDGVETYLMAYSIDGSTYIKLRDLGKALNFGVDWDSASGTVLLTAELISQLADDSATPPAPR